MELAINILREPNNSVVAACEGLEPLGGALQQVQQPGHRLEEYAGETPERTLCGGTTRSLRNLCIHFSITILILPLYFRIFSNFLIRTHNMYRHMILHKSTHTHKTHYFTYEIRLSSEAEG